MKPLCGKTEEKFAVNTYDYRCAKILLTLLREAVCVSLNHPPIAPNSILLPTLSCLPRSGSFHTKITTTIKIPYSIYGMSMFVLLRGRGRIIGGRLFHPAELRHGHRWLGNRVVHNRAHRFQIAPFVAQIDVAGADHPNEPAFDHGNNQVMF